MGLSKGDWVENDFLLSNAEVKETKAGKKYVDAYVENLEERVNVKLWNSDSVPEPGCVVHVVGVCEEFNNTLQIKATSITKTDGNPYDFVLAADVSPKVLWSETVKLLNTINNIWCNKLIHQFLDDEEIKARFLDYPAGVKVHGAYRYGLLEHTYFVMKICDSLCEIYECNRDLCLTGAFLHDIGKIRELSGVIGTEYTEIGNAVGHLGIGVMMVVEKAKQIEDFPEHILTNIVHLIASHHGEQEHGALKVPCMLESRILYAADSLDCFMKRTKESIGKNARDPFVGAVCYSGEWSDEMDSAK